MTSAELIVGLITRVEYCAKFGQTCIVCQNSVDRFSRTRGGTNSSMFANCSVFGDVREVRSSVFGQNQMFGHVQSLVLKILKKNWPSDA